MTLAVEEDIASMAHDNKQHDDNQHANDGDVPVNTINRRIPLEMWMKPTGWMQQIQPISESQVPAAQNPVVYEGYVPRQNSQRSNTQDARFPWPAQLHPPPNVTTHLVESHNFSSHGNSGSVYPEFSAMQSIDGLEGINNSHGNTYNSATNRGDTSPVSQQQELFSSDIAPTFAGSDLWQTHHAAPVFDANADFNTEVSDAAAPGGGLTGRRKRGRPSQKKQGTDNFSKQDRPSGKRGRQKGVKLGTREALDPGEEFNTLHAQATEAFLGRGDSETALQCILQAISINPEIYSAHVLLSEIYFSRGDSDKAIAALFSGAHAAPNDAVVWQQLADACLQKSSGDRTTMLKQATYCYSRMLGIDQADSDARFQKAAISRELGYYGKALKDLDVLLKDTPYNSSVMRNIAEVCIELGDITKARNLYEDALLERQSSGSADEDVFSWSDLLVYVDLISHGEDVVAAIRSLRDTSRWLVGRKEEHFWTNYIADDREWDAEHEPRRMNTPDFQSDRFPLETYGASLPLELRVKLGELRLIEGKKQEALKHFEWLDPDARGEDANVFEYPDLFLQIADALRTARDFSQALRYYDALQTINAYDDIDFWLGIAACAYVCGFKENAVAYYKKANALDSYNIDANTQLSKLYTDKGERSKAIKHAREALAVYENAVGQTEKRRYERRDVREGREAAQAAYRKAYMLSPPPGERRHTVTVPSFSRRAREKKIRADREAREAAVDDTDAEITPQDRIERTRIFKKRVTMAQRTKEQQEENVRQIYTRLCENTASMRNGDEEARSIWIECAEALVDEFRSKKSFYPAERYKTFQGYDLRPSTRKAKSSANTQTGDSEITDEADVPFPSIENSIPDEYCGILFSDWLEVFLEYALLLANLQYEPSECYTVIQAATDCCIWYHDMNALTQIYTCYLVCALALHDEVTLFSTALRWFMREYAFCSDAYRLFSALNYYYPHQTDGAGKLGQMHNSNFRAQHNQKFVFRHVAALDAQLPDDYGVDTHHGPVPQFMRRERPEIAYLKPRDNDVYNTSVTNETQNLYGASSRPPSASSTAHTPAANAPSYHETPNLRLLRPKEMDINLFIVYGQILYAGGSFPNALSYFYRALSLSPSNPVLLLTMAMCYLHQMLKRQCDNRHAYFLQGLSLFEKYAEARMQWAEEKARSNAGTGDNGSEKEDLRSIVDIVKREIEFNRARCWQMMGMTDLAMRGYEKIMDMNDVKREQNEDDEAMDIDGGDDHDHAQKHHFTMEAAYAMMVTYATNGDVDTAKAIAEKWLVVE